VNSSGKHLKIPEPLLKEQNHHLRAPRTHWGTAALFQARGQEAPDSQMSRGTDGPAERCEPQGQATVCAGVPGRAQSEAASPALRLLLVLHWTERETKLPVEKGSQEHSPATHLVCSSLCPFAPW